MKDVYKVGNMWQGLFKKYVLAFAIIFMIPLIIFSFFLQYILYSNLERDVISYNNNIVERLGDDFNNINGRLMEFSNTINFEPAVMSDLSNTENRLQVLQLLMSQSSNNPYVAKAYLIHNKGELCFSSYGIYSIEDLLSKQLSLPQNAQDDFIKTVYSTKVPNYINIEKEYITSEKRFFRDRVLFVYPLFNYRDDPDSWVILEISSLKLDDMIITTPGTYNKGIVILNKNLQELVNSNEIQVTDTLKERILKLLNKEEVYDLYLEDENALIHIMDKMDIIMVSYIEPPNLFASIISENRVLVILVFAMLFIGTIISFYMAYRYYRPIQQLSQYMKQDSDSEIVDDELNYIRKRFDQVDSMRLNLSAELDRQWPLVEERLVTKLLYYDNERQEEDFVQEFLSKQLWDKDCCVYIIKIAEKAKTHIDEELIKVKIKELQSYQSEDYVLYHTYLHHFDTYVLILSADEITQRVKDAVRKRFLSINEVFKEVCVEIAEGPVYHNVSGIRLSFLEAMALISNKKSSNQEFTSFNMEAMDVQSDQLNLDTSIFQTEEIIEIKKCIVTGDKEHIRNIIEEISMNLEGYPGHLVQVACYDIMNQVIKEIQNINVVIPQNDLKELAKFSSLDEFCRKLQSIVENICVQVNELMKDSRNILGEQVTRYIEENYTSQELSLQSISNVFNYSPSYMSKFIVQYLGDSFTNIITKKRIELTKKSLIETDKQINQIAKEAGYNNTSNFMRRFKKLEGLTPGQYRANHQKENANTKT